MIPNYLLNMAKRPMPKGVVVGESTPVIAFGNCRTARIATLGINPSVREFVEKGILLDGEKRRLSTLKSLRAKSTSELTITQAEQVISDCDAYFSRNPYGWFKPLDKIIKAAAGATYYPTSGNESGDACHLDLVQWATDPVWGKLSATIKRPLIEETRPHLEAQLDNGRFEAVLLNGRAVIDELNKSEFVNLHPHPENPAIVYGKNRPKFYYGFRNGVLFIGWTTNLQSSWGVHGDLGPAIACWLKGEISKLRAQIGQ